MLVKIFEILACLTTLAAVIYGALSLFRKDALKPFQLYVYAACCYMLEELWVIVNSLLGTGSQDGLVTVRLFGFFGCLCFMLSANVINTDSLQIRAKKKIQLVSLLAPIGLLAMYAGYVFSSANQASSVTMILGLVSLSPALLASWFSLTYLLLSTRKNTFLEASRGVNLSVLIFYIANYLYPWLDLHCSKTSMSIYDLILAVLLFVIVYMCRKGAQRCMTQI